ncbi:MAG: hypothetical protein ACT4N5_05935 [Nitrosopumilaceae archaeon]
MTEIAYPILIYDNLCYSCTRWAKITNDLLRGKCLITGHYSLLGKEIKKQLFPKDYEGLDMSWFIIDGHAFGGRSGLFRLIRYMMFESKNGLFPKNDFNLKECSTDCKTVKGAFLRSYSIITNSKKFSVMNS